jgi:Asp-tRNA(Asn)/Glu-tRNA(Gln) amidotransferase A subunit family amidase
MSLEAKYTRKQFVVGFLTALGSPAFSGLQGGRQSGGDISIEDLKAYERMIGIQFSDDERKQVLESVRQFRGTYENLRSQNIPNSVPPSTFFIPQGRQPSQKIETRMRAENWNDLAVPKSEEDIAFLSVAQLSSLIRRKKISPKELTDIYLARLKKYGGPLLNVITLTEDRARKEAAEATEQIAKGHYLGPLHGIPYGIKDLFAAKGYPTTWGAAPYKNQTFDYDSAVVEKLSEAGAVLCAKLSMGALAMNDIWFNGRTKNPWNPSQGSSGSSAGSCSAVAAGLVAFAIGTETQGSIVSPSHRCRVTGLRPTFGRVSRFGAMALSWSMDKVGPLCRTAEDCAIVLSAIIGSDTRDPSATDRPFVWKDAPNDKWVQSLKIGYMKPENTSDPDFIELLKSMGAKPKPVSFTPVPDGIQIDLSVESSAAFDAFTRTELIDELKDSAWPNIFRAHRFVPAVEYLEALRLRTIVMQKFEQELGDLDVVLTPDRGGGLLFTTNRTGHPQVLIPNGVIMRGSQEIEQSFSIFGRLYGEAEILKLGWLMQQKMKHHLKRPDLSKI